MRAILTALMLTIATQAGAGSFLDSLGTLTPQRIDIPSSDVKCDKLCKPDWWKTASVADLHYQLESGAEVMAWEGTGTTPLHLAAMLGIHKSVQVLLAAGAEATARDQRGLTSLHFANTIEKVHALITSGAVVNARSLQGWTPLHWAVNNRRDHGVVQALLDGGADVTARHDSGWTPLHLAQTIKSAQMLIAGGADINAKDKIGWTPLHHAAMAQSGGRKEDLILTLLAAGADAKAKNEAGKTPWDLAQENEYLKGTKGYWALNDAQYN
ncbi:ankyrin repeat domain-containing protein [Paracoccaceae bacterium]|nr:ankyrin repeat domain-containing protein [Paracoccaceae bacterium]